MKPARMQMQLHIVPRTGYPPRNPLHWLITEVGGLQSFEEESGTDAESRKPLEYKTEAVFLSADRPQNNGFGDGSHFRITKITADAEFGIYRYTNLDRFSISHDFRLFFMSGFQIVKCGKRSPRRGSPDPHYQDPIAKLPRRTARYERCDIRRFLWAGHRPLIDAGRPGSGPESP